MTNPVAGWNSWYAFRQAISESLVLEQARLLVSSGLAAAGYVYVNLDDTWMSSRRDPAGNLTADPAKFPSGIVSLSEQIHAMGLKLGLYTAIGRTTCQHMPASYGHYAQDARLFACWGVDFVKVDWCGGLPVGITQAQLTNLYRKFGSELCAANPDVIYSQELPVSQMGLPGFVQSVRDSAAFSNMWRVAPDEYPLVAEHAYPALLDALSRNLHLHAFAGPGRWNDMDMVAPGYPGSGWSVRDLRNQLSVWAMEASPLLISADLRSLPDDVLASLLNPFMLAVDCSGAQCANAQYSSSGQVMMLVKPYPGGGSAVCFVNLSPVATGAGVFTMAQAGIGTQAALSTDLWGSSVPRRISGISVRLAPAETRLFRFQEAA